MNSAEDNYTVEKLFGIAQEFEIAYTSGLLRYKKGEISKSEFEVLDKLNREAYRNLNTFVSKLAF